MSGRKACSTGCSGAGCRKCDHLEKCDKNCGRACEVIDKVAKALLFVRRIHQFHCPFEMPFGDGTVCTCPIHKGKHFN